MKCKKFRILIHYTKFCFLGWIHKFSERKIPLNKLGNGWYCISDFSTKIKMRQGFGGINDNRISNMELSCDFFDKILLEPGEIFSMQKIIGEPSKNKGFRGGPTIVEGLIHCSIGGGLCQISSTIFNAALMANLEILEKYNHSVDTWGNERIVDLGRDATYAYALKDLKFRNNFKNRIIIRLNVDRNKKMVNCSVWAKEKLPYTVNIRSDVIKEVKPKIKSKFKGKAITGWLVETKRYVKSDVRVEITYKKREFYKPQIVYYK